MVLILFKKSLAADVISLSGDLGEPQLCFAQHSSHWQEAGPVGFLTWPANAEDLAYCGDSEQVHVPSSLLLAIKDGTF